MNKSPRAYLFIIVLFLLAFNMCDCIAQSTHYYRLTKIIEKGKSYTNTAGGQFITFRDDYCFESDKYGTTVGHGTLKYEEKYSADLKTYMGNSYFGNVVFRFNTEKSILNIIVPGGITYVYKRSTPPANVTTCSLIKGKPSGGSGGASPVNNLGSGYTPPPPPMNNGSGAMPSKTLKTKEIRYKEDCPNCRGKGSIIQNTYPATFGTNLPDVWCSECGRYFSADTGHTHRQCNHCRGTGKVEKVRYENVYE